ncbi:DUF6777 domain-containing protein [Streptomyces sp. NPDC058655]|uniref:DUF6777 domain-containing protein n=1 Tax=Streptomyces sp. NPDC058655 TaxID=3346577 RepID=UPI0036557EE9
MPRLATALVAVAAVVALVVVLTRPSGTSPKAGGEVFLQPAAASGPDPFTESTATTPAQPPPQSPPPPPTGRTTGPGATAGTATPSVSGSSPGLYGGTRSVASCDVEKQITVLAGQPAKNTAFASALGIRPAAVPGYLRSLTPVQLRFDTRVTNHGYREGRATAYQAVLQAGTAVLVDDRGVPRVRCACGNPLAAPVPLEADPKRFGQAWSGYRPAQVIVIAPSVTVVNKIVIYDHEDRRWYERDRGPKPQADKPVAPPVFPTPKDRTPPATTSPPDTGTRTPPDTGTPTDADTATDTPTDADTTTGTGTPTDADTATGTPDDGLTGTPTDSESETAPGTASDPATPEDGATDTSTATDSRAPGLTDRSGTTPSGSRTPATPSAPGTDKAP